MRGDTWRTWDFFWMLHNMDYVNRKSFNHPLIIFVAFGALWLSGTGFYLLFKSFSRADFRWLRRRRTPVVTRSAACRVSRRSRRRPTARSARARKSVGWGRSEYVRVDLGGCLCI